MFKMKITTDFLLKNIRTILKVIGWLVNSNNKKLEKSIVQYSLLRLHCQQAGQTLKLSSWFSQIWARGSFLTFIPYISIISEPAVKTTPGIIKKLAKYFPQNSKTHFLSLTDYMCQEREVLGWCKSNCGFCNCF